MKDISSCCEPKVPNGCNVVYLVSKGFPRREEVLSVYIDGRILFLL